MYPQFNARYPSTSNNALALGQVGGMPAPIPLAPPRHYRPQTISYPTSSHQPEVPSRPVTPLKSATRSNKRKVEADRKVQESPTKRKSPAKGKASSSSCKPTSASGQILQTHHSAFGAIQHAGPSSGVLLLGASTTSSGDVPVANQITSAPVNPLDLAYLSALPPRYYPATSQALSQQPRATVHSEAPQPHASIAHTNDVEMGWTPARKRGAIPLPSSYSLADKKATIQALMRKNPNLHIYDFMVDSDDEHADCSKIGDCLLHGKNRKKTPAKVRHEPPPAPFPCENQMQGNFIVERRYSEVFNEFIAMSPSR